MNAEKLRLPYGTYSLPENVRVAWGARWIWPDDQLFDRQGCAGGTDEERQPLLAWLNDGVGEAARAEARRLAKNYELTGRENRAVTLYEDDKGIVIGNPQKSYGYLYVGAWLKEHAR